LTAIGRLVFFCLARARGESFVDEVRHHPEVFRAVLEASDGVQALERVMRYIQLVSDVDRPAIEAVLAEHVGPKAREAFVTIAERLIQAIEPWHPRPASLWVPEAPRLTIAAHELRGRAGGRR
jgi:hypothetical protein